MDEPWLTIVILLGVFGVPFLVLGLFYCTNFKPWKKACPNEPERSLEDLLRRDRISFYRTPRTTPTDRTLASRSRLSNCQPDNSVCTNESDQNRSVQRPRTRASPARAVSYTSESGQIHRSTIPDPSVQRARQTASYTSVSGKIHRLPRSMIPASSTPRTTSADCTLTPPPWPYNCQPDKSAYLGDKVTPTLPPPYTEDVPPPPYNEAIYSSEEADS